MFKLNKKLLYFFGSNLVGSNVYCIKIGNIELVADNKVYTNKNKDSNLGYRSLSLLIQNLNFEDFLCGKNKFSNAVKGKALYKIIATKNYKDELININDEIDEKCSYKIYYKGNYIKTSDDSKINIEEIDGSKYKKYEKSFTFFIDDLKNIKKESDLVKYIFNIIYNISKDFSDFNTFYEKYYIDKFTIDDSVFIDDQHEFKKESLEEIIAHSGKKKFEIKLTRYINYKLTDIYLGSDLKKIYKFKKGINVIEKINSIISKSKNALNLDDLQKIITNDLGFEGIVLNNLINQNLDVVSYIVINEDPKKHFIETKNCNIKFTSNDFLVENDYKNSIRVTFDNKINENVKVKEYIFNEYGLSNDNCEIFDKNSNKIDKENFKDEEQYIIKITKEVDKITKKKKADDVIINIEISSDKPDEFKLKDNVTKNTQIVLKKGSCEINDLLTNLKNNGYNGIEKDGIIEGIFLVTDPSNNFLESKDDLTTGQYKILLSGQENDFVEKVEKKPTNKNITLTIVPKNNTKYELNEILNNISVSVIENISYNNFVNEVKKTITDGKFEVYINDNIVESGNIDINNQIVIKLLDGCNKLKEIKKDEKGDGDGNGDSNGGGDNGGNKGNGSNKSTKKCCQYSKK